jgi:hypothetical protein
VKYRRYARGSVVAVEDDVSGNILLRLKHKGSLLRPRDGVPQVIVERADAADVAAIFACIAEDLDREACAQRGVEVTA